MAGDVGENLDTNVHIIAIVSQDIANIKPAEVEQMTPANPGSIASHSK